MIIKEVPSKIVNHALDKWINISLLRLPENTSKCSYCNYFRRKYKRKSNHILNYKCIYCPLTDIVTINNMKQYIKNYKIEIDPDIVCCNGLWREFKKYHCYYNIHNWDIDIKKKMNNIADKITDLIIDIYRIREGIIYETYR